MILDDAPALLAGPHLSVVGRGADHEFVRVVRTLRHSLVVGSRGELASALRQLAAAGLPPTSKTLDLIGHSTAPHSLLRLGEWIIDGRDPTVIAFARELAREDVLVRLGISAVRLLGCATAAGRRGQETLRALDQAFGVEVWGTTDLLLSSYYQATGFAHERRYLLTSSRRSHRVPRRVPARA